MLTSQENLDLLLEAMRGIEEIFILPHNDPDPDAIASAVALKYLLAHKAGITASIFYKGIIGRAENKALIKYLNHPLQKLATSSLEQTQATALVDTQPGTGNHALPPDCCPLVVIDHHPLLNGTDAVSFSDIRPKFGSAATILTEYLQIAHLEPPPELATALFYGIKTDTMGLGRNISPADVQAYFYLQPKIDVEALIEIERAQVPADYFRNFDATLHAARVFGELVISYIGDMVYPDLVAEMADLLLRLKGSQWVICMGVYRETFTLAIRTRKPEGKAGKLARYIVGHRGSAGGHDQMAGGQVPLANEDAEELAFLFRHRALEYFHMATDMVSRPLI